MKWHVSYYYKDNAPHIILDSENGDYQVVQNLAGFSSAAPSSSPAQGNPSDKASADNDIVSVDESKSAADKTTAVDVITVIAGFLFGLMVIVFLVFLAFRFAEYISDFMSECPIFQQRL